MDHLDAHSRELTREHLAALDALRIAKNAFLWLAAVAIALHICAWWIVKGDGVRAESAWQQGDAQPLSVSTDRPAADRDAHRWNARLESALIVAGFVGRSSVLVIAGLFIISLLVSLSAKLGGAAALAKACVWALAALALVTPWVRVDSERMIGLRSGLYGIDELHVMPTMSGSFMDELVSVVRFVLCPLLVALFLVLGQLQFRKAYRKIILAPKTKLPIREV